MVLWDGWLRGQSLKAIGRAFGKPSSLFIACWPPVLRRPVEITGVKRTSLLARNASVVNDPERTFGVEGADQQDGPQRRTRHRADDAAELTRESRHTFLFKANHKRATASEGVEYKSSYPSYPDAVHRHFPQSKIREKNFSPHAVMSSERVGRNQLSVGASSPSE